MVSLHLVPAWISQPPAHERPWEVHEWRNACAVLKEAHPEPWGDVLAVLEGFRLRRSAILEPGGGKSPISRAIDSALYARGWKERDFATAIVVDEDRLDSPTHKIDCFKDKVGLEIEWNNKDPFYDRDLNNFRLLFELRVIDAGIIVTRCDHLQAVFDGLGKGASYGASTTHMSKLLPRVEGGRWWLPRGRLRHQRRPLRSEHMSELAHRSLLSATRTAAPFRTILADPPWRFQNRTGKMAPEHLRLARYSTMDLAEIQRLPVESVCDERAHLYLWVPNALLAEGMAVLSAWGFTYKTNLVWYKTRKDGGPDGRGVGFYFRNVTELVLFGIKGKDNRTLAPGRRQVNLMAERKREHSRKPEQLYDIIESCSCGPYLEMFARTPRDGWSQWGNELKDYTPERFSSAPYGVRRKIATA